MTLDTLPTLDGSVVAAVARLEAWSSVPLREKMARISPKGQTNGERWQQLSLLDLAEVPL